MGELLDNLVAEEQANERVGGGRTFQEFKGMRYRFSKYKGKDGSKEAKGSFTVNTDKFRTLGLENTGLKQLNKKDENKKIIAVFLGVCKNPEDAVLLRNSNRTGSKMKTFKADKLAEALQEAGVLAASPELGTNQYVTLEVVATDKTINGVVYSHVCSVTVDPEGKDTKTPFSEKEEEAQKPESTVESTSEAEAEKEAEVEVEQEEEPTKEATAEEEEDEEWD